jgi:transcriptional regulator with XRE-family HTH domain
MNIIENLRKIRESKKLSQEKMADLMNKSQSAYARIERGATKINLKDLILFSKAVEMELIDVITYPDKYVKQCESNDVRALLQIELKKDKTKVKSHYQNLGKHKASDFKKKVMKNCGWSERTFYRKLNHPESINNLEMAQIEIIVTGARQLTINDQLEQEVKP